MEKQVVPCAGHTFEAPLAPLLQICGSLSSTSQSLTLPPSILEDLNLEYLGSEK